MKKYLKVKVRLIGNHLASRKTYLVRAELVHTKDHELQKEENVLALEIVDILIDVPENTGVRGVGEDLVIENVQIAAVDLVHGIAGDLLVDEDRARVLLIGKGVGKGKIREIEESNVSDHVRLEKMLP